MQQDHNDTQQIVARLTGDPDPQPREDGWYAIHAWSPTQGYGGFQGYARLDRAFPNDSVLEWK